MRSNIFGAMYGLLAVAVLGCAGAQVTQSVSSAPITATQPTAVVVYPFAVDTSDVSLNSGILQTAYENHGLDAFEASGVLEQGAEQLQLAHQTAQNICVQVATNLTQKGITATCLQRGVPPAGNNVLVLDGQFTDISEGNRLRRMVIGLRAGASKVDSVVQVIQKTPQGSSDLLDFATSADSGHMPGAGITGPAGTAAGGATAAASPGVNLAAGGVKNYTSSTGYLVDKTSDQIVQQMVNYYNRQGWSA